MLMPTVGVFYSLVQCLGEQGYLTCVAYSRTWFVLDVASFGGKIRIGIGEVLGMIGGSSLCGLLHPSQKCDIGQMKERIKVSRQICESP